MCSSLYVVLWMKHWRKQTKIPAHGTYILLRARERDSVSRMSHGGAGMGLSLKQSSPGGRPKGAGDTWVKIWTWKCCLLPLTDLLPLCQLCGGQGPTREKDTRQCVRICAHTGHASSVLSHGTWQVTLEWIFDRLYLLPFPVKWSKIYFGLCSVVQGGIRDSWLPLVPPLQCEPSTQEPITEA